MKRFLGIFLVVFLAISLSTCVLAIDDDFTIKTPRGFTAAYDDDNLSDLSKIFGVQVDTLEDYIDDNDIVYIAADDDNTCQITLSETDNEFSEKTVSFALLSDEELTTLSTTIAKDTFENHGIVSGTDGNKFIKLTKKSADSGGAFLVTEYITVCNSELYTLSISAQENCGYDELANTVFEDFEINNSLLKKSSSNLTFTILAVIGIALLAAVVVFLSINVYKDYKTNKK